MTQHSAELLAASDADIDAAMKYADPMALRGLLYQLTGDEEVRAVKVAMHTVGVYRELWHIVEQGRHCPDPGQGRGVPQVLPGLRRGRPPDRPRGAAAGQHRPGRRYRRSRPRNSACGWRNWPSTRGPARSSGPARPTPSRAAQAGFSVLVIGAGMGGLNAAVQLKHAGIPFTLLEKNSTVGGTWWENRYPGCRVDTPSRTYSHLYGVGFAKPYPYCPQPENEKYLNWVADTFERARRHRVRHRGQVDRLGRGRRGVGGHHRAARRSPHLAGQRRDQLGRVPVPAEHSRTFRASRTSAASGSTPPAGRPGSTWRASGWPSSAPAAPDTR